MQKKYSNICTYIYRFVIAICIILVIVMMAASGLQVFSRYVLNSTFSWTDECSRYCFIWFNLLGAGCLVRSHGHAVVDLFSDKLPEKVRKVYHLFVNSMIFYMGIILTKFGWGLCRATMRQTSTALKLPMGLVYGALPVLGTLILIYQVETIWELLVNSSKRKEGV